MTRPAAAFQERLRVPSRWWLQGGLLVATFWLAMIVAIPEPAAWIITAALTTLLVGGLWTYGSARVAVDQGWLYAGSARIEIKFVGAAQTLDATQTRATAGPLANARALLLLRPYLREAVLIPIDDPADRTPYWLVSSRHVEALAKALQDAKASAKEAS